MSGTGKRYTARYARGDPGLDQHTSKLIGTALFSGFPKVEREKNKEGEFTEEIKNLDDQVKASRDLMKFSHIVGKNQLAGMIFLASMRDLYGSEVALWLVNIAMGYSVSVNGIGRIQGTDILSKSGLPKEIETLVNEL